MSSTWHMSPQKKVTLTEKDFSRMRQEEGMAKRH